MTKEVEWYVTSRDTKDKRTAEHVYRAIRWKKETSEYVLISGRQNPGISGDTHVTEVEFENPKILADAITSLSISREVSLRAKGTVTRTQEAWDHSQASPIDIHVPDVIETGMVSLTLKTKRGVLAPFESTIHIKVE
jgi:hypothetical protein